MRDDDEPVGLGGDGDPDAPFTPEEITAMPDDQLMALLEDVEPDQPEVMPLLTEAARRGL